ncbi:Esterase [Fusarium oxysporum f. sp. cubense race 1]|uniref:Esterase n=1 Tax=Fusarium oxysporum f. sp. cubense (strain race 1) TaxID=1229664 RepID=N4U267_FUSC1|nr:Esterase [Fusarium oxysporum f. sp. cubense race 1]
MPHKFSNLEKLQLALRLTCIVPWQMFASVSRSLLIAWTRGLPARLFLVCAVIKVVLRTFSPRQIQYLSLSTKEAYKSWIRRRIAKAKKVGDLTAAARLRYDWEPLDDGNSSLLWIGNRREAKKVVLFCHGGGYVCPLLPGHLEWCWRAYVAAGIEMETEVAVAVLEYTLCPEARYPVQLRQAADALAHLLSSKVRPRDIVIGGDSAGANLTAQLLCHLIEPHPAVPEVLLPEPLLGAFLVSPWVTRCTDDASFRENCWIDMLSGPTVDKSTRELLGPDIEETSASLAFPLDRDKSCFEGMESILKQLYVSVGAHEVFRDQGIALVREIRHLNPKLDVRVDMQTRQAHDFILLEGQEERDGECIQHMKDWMRDLLATRI